MVKHAYNPTMQEVKVRRSGIQASLGYTGSVRLAWATQDLDLLPQMPK